MGAFAPFHLLEVDPDIFGLEVAEGNFLAGEAEVRRAAGDAFGLVGGRNTRVERFQQRLERRAVSVLSGVALLEFALDLSAVSINRGCGHASLPTEDQSRGEDSYHKGNGRAIPIWRAGATAQEASRGNRPRTQNLVDKKKELS